MIRYQSPQKRKGYTDLARAWLVFGAVVVALLAYVALSPSSAQAQREAVPRTRSAMYRSNSIQVTVFHELHLACAQPLPGASERPSVDAISCVRLVP